MRSRRRWIILGVVLLVATGGVLWLTAGEPVGGRRLLLGHWRARDALAAVVLIYLAVMFLAAGISRKLMFASWAISIMLFLVTLLLELLSLAGLVNYAVVFQRGYVLGQYPTPNIDVRGETYQDIATLHGVRTAPIAYRYKTDRRGYRNDIDRAEADIYMVGDSVVVAGLVPFEKTFTARVEAELKRPVVNIALVKTGVHAQRKMVREAQVPLKGKLLLHFVFEGNDLYDCREFRRGQDGRKAPVVTRSFTYNLYTTLQEWSQPRSRESTLEYAKFGSEEIHFFTGIHRGMDQEVPYFLKELEGFAQETQEAGGRYAIVYIPDKLRVLGPYCTFPPDSDIKDYLQRLSPLRDPLKQWAAERKIPVLDPTEALQACAAGGKNPWFNADSHPNEVGHAVIADQLLKWDELRK